MSYLILFRCRNLKILHKRYSSTTLIEQKSEDSGIIRKKFNEIIKWYEQITGMDEVRMMQNRVLDAQDKFVACQDKRRLANKELAIIQSKLKDIYSELDTTSRGEERYLHLVTLEHVLLKDEKKLAFEFSHCEKEERETFSMLSACVKESHEKERAQAERTKYWSVIGSVVGTIIGVIGSSISNEFKMKELRSLVNAANEATESLTFTSTNSVLAKHEQQLASLLHDMKNIVNNFSDKGEMAVVHRIDKLLHTISNKQSAETEHYITDSVDKLHRTIDEIKSLLISAQRHDGHLIAIPADMESIIKQQKKETRYMVTGVAVIAIVVPILLAYLQRL